MQWSRAVKSTASVVYTSDRGIILYGDVPKSIGKVYEFDLGLAVDLFRGISAGLSALDLTNQRRPEQFGFTVADRDYPTPGRRVVFELHAATL